MLSKARELPDVSVIEIGVEDDAAWDGWRDRIRARSAIVLEEERRRLQQLGLIDEDWGTRTAELPDDMRPLSKTSVET